MRSKHLPLSALASLAVAGLLFAGCGSDSDDAATTTTVAASTTEAATTTTEDGAKAHTEASKEELEEWQTDLNAVGCWAGQVDGEQGPQTESAIKAFQAASGLQVDGLLGPKTESALGEAAAAGEVVCTDTTGTTTPGGSGGGTADLSSSTFENSFTIGSCTSADETSIDLQGEVNNITLTAKATGGSGSIEVSGGTEEDGVEMSGTITSVEVGDTGDFTVEGTLSDGSAYTLTGSCT